MERRLTLLMCSYNAIQSGTLNTKREREKCVPFHLYSPISPPFSRTHFQSLSSFSPFTSLAPKFTCTTADAAKERKVCCTRRSRPRRRRCPCCLVRPAAPAWPAASAPPPRATNSSDGAKRSHGTTEIEREREREREEKANGSHPTIPSG